MISIHRWFAAVAIMVAAALVSGRAAAHPHVFVTMKTEVLYNADGAITGFRQAWTFDDMYSSFAVYGLDVNEDGAYDRAELQSLADVNVQSLSAFGYFTFPRVRDAKLPLLPPRDYWLEHKDNLLTLHFISDLAEPLPPASHRDFTLRIYDREIYMSFKFDANRPVTLSGAPEGCASRVSRPSGVMTSMSLSEADFQNLSPDADIGAQFAAVVTILCGEEAIAAAAQDAAGSGPVEPLVAEVDQAEAREDAAALREALAATLQPSPAVASSAEPVANDGGEGFVAWVQRTQSELSERIGGAIRDLKSDSPWLAGLTMAALSFLYGVVHAAGPGHGKAVISSYVLANERTLRRGVALAVVSSFAQAVTAVMVVGVLALALRQTNAEMQSAARAFEIASFALIALAGMWMLYNAMGRMARAFAAPVAMRSLSAAAAPAIHAHRPHAHKAHVHAHARGAHVHGPDCGCGHAHAPDPRQLDGDVSWRQAAAIVLAIGLRPCSGALIVLVFALSQGLWWAGVASTFAMAAGTAITVSALAVFAVGSRNMAARLAGGDVAGRRLEAVAALGGALIVLAIGVVFFTAALQPPKPFGF
ncbi:MAG: DUF1007 family protein [Hyphomicrobiales bacterium]|nr:DUF1007 family protein [Hyphomicrobiales bacterium]